MLFAIPEFLTSGYSGNPYFWDSVLHEIPEFPECWNYRKNEIPENKFSNSGILLW